MSSKETSTINKYGRYLIQHSKFSDWISTVDNSLDNSVRIDAINEFRKIGFPTANIQIKNDRKLIPADGVYAVKVNVDNKKYYGMLNIGVKPTTENNNHQIEVHIFDFSKQIYGQEIYVELVKHIRNEKKFKDLNALQHQLKKDENNCKKFFKILR